MSAAHLTIYLCLRITLSGLECHNKARAYFGSKGLHPIEDKHA